MIATDMKFRTYARAFCAHWFTLMCGSLTVPFAALALWFTSYLRILWGCLAVTSFVLASYTVWRKEHTDFLRELDSLSKEIVLLNRKPYREELERLAAQTVAQLTENGRRVLRHLLQNEPLDVGRQFIADISHDMQSEQTAIAFRAGIVRHSEVRTGAGTLLRTDLLVNQQYRPVLEDLLYPRT